MPDIMPDRPYKDDDGSAERFRDSSPSRSRASVDYASSMSSTSAVLEHIHDDDDDDQMNGNGIELKERKPLMSGEDNDVEDGPYRRQSEQPPTRRTLVVVYALCGVCLAGWLLALFLFLKNGTYQHKSVRPHDPHATAAAGNGKLVTFNSVLNGEWYPMQREVSWIKGSGGEDGLILEKDSTGFRGYLVVQDVRSLQAGASINHPPQVLMESAQFAVNGKNVLTDGAIPSSDLKNVLVTSDVQSNWRHSTTAQYWVFNVEQQTGEPLDPVNPDARIQLAIWSPTSDSIVFTRDNNMYLRKIGDSVVTQITRDGGAELFYGVPDWVYEEEVLSGASATWWSADGAYIAYLRTDESRVPSYPVQYFIDRPSGEIPPEGLKNYPETRKIKYPKAGAPNPTVSLKFYDVMKRESFDVDIADDFADDDRLITEVVWGGSNGEVIIRETNRESDILKIVLIDVVQRTGRTVRSVDVNALDGGWFEVSEYTKFVPADPSNGRPYDGYIDTVIHKGYDHLAYFAPMNNSEPTLLTSGKWEVIDAPSSVDLQNNLVYFMSTEKDLLEKHVYSVKLDGSERKPFTDVTQPGYFDVSFSTGSGYALLTCKGPDIPYQKVISTESLKGDSFDLTLEDNAELASKASATELPHLIYSSITIDGFDLPVIERRPYHFNPKKRYPVLFYLYGGPGSTLVNRKFTVDFQSYVASSLGYIVVTLDGRGTGVKGRVTRCIVRGNLGYYEAYDQIAAAKEWAAKPYVDPDRMAVWGWSYGGFLTLKTLEMDAGRTFKYGLAVAPVTDWRYYDSVYTERYMHTPQHNPGGYENATVQNVTALGENVRFLIQHGTGDDNVHVQNSYTLLDKLDQAGVQNYDFHAYPDSDHSIYFHNANNMVYGRLSNWLINAFNGEWLKVDDARPLKDIDLNGMV
jgi:dipeptidyl aminopeptidase B